MKASVTPTERLKFFRSPPSLARMNSSMSGWSQRSTPHLRAAACAGRFDRLARAVEHAHVAHRPRGTALRAADPRTARADAREVVTDAAASAHRFGRFGECGVDAGVAVLGLRDRVTDRLHEAVDQRGREPRARGRLDAPGRHEARPQCLSKPRLPVRALRRRLGLREGARDAQVHRIGGGLVALGVFFQQHLGADVLRGQVVQCRGRSRVGRVHGATRWVGEAPPRARLPLCQRDA